MPNYAADDAAAIARRLKEIQAEREAIERAKKEPEVGGGEKPDNTDFGYFGSTVDQSDYSLDKWQAWLGRQGEVVDTAAAESV